jgi:ribose transport system ATP-binding protein
MNTAEHSDLAELEAREVVKTFSGVRALRGVSFRLERGQVHALIGENGAGKSTLMNVLAGVLPPDSGALYHRGRRLGHLSPHRAQQLGIGFVRQDPALVADLTVADNITLGAESHRAGVLRSDRRRVGEHLRRLGITLDPGLPVGRLGPAQRQLVSVAKVLLADPEVLILDEPTAPLTSQEKDLLFGLVRDFTGRGRSVIYISHRLEEIFEIADRATVLRDGEVVATVRIGEAGVDRDHLVRMMVGRELTAMFPERSRSPEGTGGGLVVHDVLAAAAPDLVVGAGEILGVAGLVGSGRSRLLQSIFGANPARRLTLTLDGRRLRPRSPAAAVEAGIALVPEDRRGQGLVPPLTIGENIPLAAPRAVARGGWIDRRRDLGVARRLLAELNIKALGPQQVVAHLSGGNQQKVVLAKWLLRDSKVILLDEPTNGIDVGARAEIYRQISRLADAGKVVVLVSSEMPELLGLADRIAVMSHGEITALFDRRDATQERILDAALSGRPADSAQED